MFLQVQVERTQIQAAHPLLLAALFAEVTGLNKQMSIGSKPCNMLSFTSEKGRVSVSPNVFIALMLYVLIMGLLPSTHQQHPSALSIFIMGRENHSNNLEKGRRVLCAQRMGIHTDQPVFQNICLLSVEGKIFFSVLAKRMSAYMTHNGYFTILSRSVVLKGSLGAWSIQGSSANLFKKQRRRKVA